MYCWGIYARYYYESGLFPGVSLTTLSWIGALGAALTPGVGPFAGRAADIYNGRLICLAGVVGCFVAVSLGDWG
jgi:hypothetical protein